MSTLGSNLLILEFAAELPALEREQHGLHILGLA
jgi:hypothetical protein